MRDLFLVLEKKFNFISEKKKQRRKSKGKICNDLSWILKQNARKRIVAQLICVISRETNGRVEHLG